MSDALAVFDENFRKERGCALLCGVDEAGRGPLAGPVVAAAVVFGGVEPVFGLDDSKKLNQKKRSALREAILASGALFCVGAATAAEIDEKDILSATFSAMRRAIAGLPSTPGHVLVDGNHEIRGLDLPQTPVIKGDSLSASIAAASILAKEHRDALMREYDREFPGYGFAEHAGYGTAAHLKAIAALGPCPIHRKTFRGVREHTGVWPRNGSLF